MCGIMVAADNDNSLDSSLVVLATAGVPLVPAVPLTAVVGLGTTVFEATVGVVFSFVDSRLPAPDRLSLDRKDIILRSLVSRGRTRNQSARRETSQAQRRSLEDRFIYILEATSSCGRSAVPYVRRSLQCSGSSEASPRKARLGGAVPQKRVCSAAKRSKIAGPIHPGCRRTFGTMSRGRSHAESRVQTNPVNWELSR